MIEMQPIVTHEPNRPWWKNWIVMIIAAVVVLGVIAVLLGDEPEELVAEVEPTPEPEPEPVPEELEPEPEPGIEPAAYEVVAVDETGLERINARVVVDGQPDQETLIATAEAVVLELRDEYAYTGAAAFFYADTDPTDGAYTLARATDAPFGDWSEAAEAQAGVYSDHVIVIDAREKDWTQQPTAEDVDIYVSWIELNDELFDEVDFEELDAETDRRLAEQLGLEPEKVHAAVERVFLWFHSGEQATVQR